MYNVMLRSDQIYSLMLKIFSISVNWPFVLPDLNRLASSMLFLFLNKIMKIGLVS